MTILRIQILCLFVLSKSSLLWNCLTLWTVAVTSPPLQAIQYHSRVPRLFHLCLMYSNDFKRHTAHENGKQLHEHAITRARKRTALDFLATVPQRASPPAKCGTVRQRDIEAVIDDSFRTDSSPMRSNGWSERWGSGCWILIHIMHTESM